MKILMFGTFDDLHPGHHTILEEGLKRGELYVVVARDTNVERIKGRPPLQNEEQRMAVIQSMYPDASVILGDSNDFMQPVRDVQPDLILLGYDQRMPPTLSEDDLPCPIERLPAHDPHIHKSSLRRKKLSSE